MLLLICRRLCRGIITMMIVLTFVFLGTRLTGTPLDKMFPDGLSVQTEKELSQKYGIDRPIMVQYLIYVRQIAKGDFGRSIVEHRPVTWMYREDMGGTLRLGCCALLLSITVGLAIGILGVLRRNLCSRTLLALVSVGYAAPHFIIAILMLLLFSYHLHWLPSKGGDSWLCYLMPTLTLAAHPIAAVARHVRNSLLETVSQDYIRTARAKGLPEHWVIFKHALRNALIPVLTVIGLLITDLVAGSIIVESVFSWPGIGKRLVGAVMDRDYPVLQFGVICFALVVVAVNLAIDILYVVIDPRIRMEA